MEWQFDTPPTGSAVAPPDNNGSRNQSTSSNIVPYSPQHTTHQGDTFDLRTFKNDIFVWYDPEHAIADICFIHGLSGSRDSTWTHKSKTTPWPEEFLPQDDVCKEARLLTFGYDAYVVKSSGASKNRLADHANNLLADL